MSIKKEKNVLEKALTGLIEKYNVPAIQPFLMQRDDESPLLQLIHGYDLGSASLKDNQIPLLAWRTGRKFMELKKIVDEAVIEHTSLIRFCAMGSRDKWSLFSLLYRELDLLEFISQAKIISLHAVMNKNQSGNLILRLNNNVLCSIELSAQSPPGTALIERHEMIARRGVASDMVVDTQIPQRAVYSYTESGENRYNDVDMELYGLDSISVDHVRSALEAIKNRKLKEEWRQQHEHLIALIGMAFESNERQKKITVNKEGILL